MTVEFHPKATALLTGGPDQTLRLFAVSTRIQEWSKEMTRGGEV